MAPLNTVAMLTIRAAYDCDASDDRPPLGKFCLEPISKSPEEDNEAGELDEAEKVVGVVFPADEDATLPLYPGEEALSGEELARCRTLRLGPFPVPPHKNCS